MGNADTFHIILCFVNCQIVYKCHFKGSWIFKLIANDSSTHLSVLMTNIKGEYQDNFLLKLLEFGCAYTLIPSV